MRTFVTLICLLGATLGVVRGEVPSDPVPSVATLPTPYPDSWIFIVESYPHNRQIGKVILLDLASPNKHYKGDVQASLFGNFLESKTRPELYVSETVYSRGSYGDRIDLVVIYDKESLTPITEIILPGEKRGMLQSRKEMFALSDDEKLAYIYNFTPAASVTVVDMELREVIGEVPIPGCSLLYPYGGQSFFSLCANGSLVSISIDYDGKVLQQDISPVFNDIEGDPLFMESAVGKDEFYFLSFKGFVQPISTTRATPRIETKWPLVTDAIDRVESWRPAGMQPIAADSVGRLYILMRKHAVSGTHRDLANEVWVFDAKTQKRLSRIPLLRKGYSVIATSAKTPLLAVANGDDEIEVYDPDTGEHLRTIGGWRNVTPFALQAVK